jgi:hypothetical protein
MNSPSGYTIGAMTRGAIDRAYALLRAVGSPPNLAEWRDFCHAIVSNPIDDDSVVGRERIVIARNSKEYVRGLCIYCVRDHWFYGRLLDVPIFIVASAADAEGITIELLRFLQETSLEHMCMGARFWTMDANVWNRRRSEKDVLGNDHGIFLPITDGIAKVEDVRTAWTHALPALVERLSR